jgi:hypothetical protein
MLIENVLQLMKNWSYIKNGIDAILVGTTPEQLKVIEHFK